MSTTGMSSKGKEKAVPVAPSSNWAALKQKLHPIASPDKDKKVKKGAVQKDQKNGKKRLHAAAFAAEQEEGLNDAAGGRKKKPKVAATAVSTGKDKDKAKVVPAPAAVPVVKEQKKPVAVVGKDGEASAQNKVPASSPVKAPEVVKVVVQEQVEAAPEELPSAPAATKEEEDTAPPPAKKARPDGPSSAPRDSPARVHLTKDEKRELRKASQVVPIASILHGPWPASQRKVGTILALDCEMVGVGHSGTESVLARVSIVNYHGWTVFDSFVRPREKVTDYRTWVSGVRAEDVQNAPTFMEVQKQVAALLDPEKTVLVGHALSNDSAALLLSHPHPMTRDTSTYPPFRALARTKMPGLKKLVKLVLGVEIQEAEHSSVIDARATMALYRSQKPAWESALFTKKAPTLLVDTTPFLPASWEAAKLATGESIKKKEARAKTLGLAATLRHVKNEAEREKGDLFEGFKATVGGGGAGAKEDAEEEDDEFVLGFTTAAVEPSTSGTKKEEPRPKKVYPKGGVSKGKPGVQRTKSTKNWWE